MVDTCAAEFEAVTPYFYSTYEEENEAPALTEAKVLVIGSGPIRIGQGIEFDYASVHAVWALQEAGYKALIANSNPETVSTDCDTSDRLYYETLDLAEDRRQFEAFLNSIGIPQPPGAGVRTIEDALRTADRIGYPVLVR